MKPNSQKKHSQIIDSAIIWITLGTLFAVPIIFNYFHVVSVFSELKLVTLHLGAALISILWLWELTRESQFSINLSKQQIGWGSQIRSYVLHPYKLIKDLRTNHEASNVNDVLDGEIDSFLEKSLYL